LSRAACRGYLNFRPDDTEHLDDDLGWPEPARWIVPAE
jgi:hypothetical protein